MNCSVTIAHSNDRQLCMRAKFMLRMYTQFEEHLLSSINSVI